jgi:protein TonB
VNTLATSPRSLNALDLSVFEQEASRKPGTALSVAIVVSVLVHALLLSLQFRMPAAAPVKDKGLAVVLVNARHARAPEQAELLAQANLDGGGTTEQEARPTTPLPPQDTQRDGDALVEARPRSPEPERVHKPALTRQQAPASTSTSSRPVEHSAPTPQPRGRDLLDSAAAVARLEAEIDRQLDEIAKRPRRVFIGARAREYRFAQYVEDWRQKVERIGTLNYPDAARGKLYGNLLLSVSIRADGSIEKVHVSRSSGHKLLDDAAIHIVTMAAPYAAFPPDIRKDADIIEITRTWTFTNADQLRTQ